MLTTRAYALMMVASSNISFARLKAKKTLIDADGVVSSGEYSKCSCANKQTMKLINKCITVGKSHPNPM